MAKVGMYFQLEEGDRERVRAAAKRAHRSVRSWLVATVLGALEGVELEGVAGGDIETISSASEPLPEPIPDRARLADDEDAARAELLGTIRGLSAGRDGLVTIAEVRASFPGTSELRFRHLLLGMGSGRPGRFGGTVEFLKLNDRAKATAAGLDAELVSPFGQRFYYVRPARAIRERERLQRDAEAMVLERRARELRERVQLQRAARAFRELMARGSGSWEGL